MPARVLIAGYYGFGNTGDEAILAAMLRDLRARVPGLAPVVVSGDPGGTARLHAVESVPWNDLRAIAAAARGADLVLLGGGGLFHDYWGFDPATILTRRHGGIAYYGTFPLLASLLDRPFMLYAVGVGPLLGEDGRQHTRAAFEQAAAATVRDPASLDLLATLGLDIGQIGLSADPSFCLRPAPPDEARALLAAEGFEEAARPLIGVVLREWDVGVSQDEWVRQVGLALDGFADRHDARLVFMPFQQLDQPLVRDHRVAEQVRQQMARADRCVVLRGRYTAEQQAGILARCDLVLGMRLHAGIFAAVGGVPLVALSYDPKVRALADQLGCPEYALDLADLSADSLLERLEAAWAERPALSARLEQAAERLAGLAEASAIQAARLLETAGQQPRPTAALPPLLKDLLLERSLRLDELLPEGDDGSSLLEQRERQIEHLKAQVTQQAEGIEWLRQELSQARSEVTASRSLLELRQSQIEYLKAQVTQQAEGIEWLRQELSGIQQGRAYRAARAAWQVYDRAAALAHAFRVSATLSALRVGRRLLPWSIKRRVLRYWDPYRGLSPDDRARLGLPAPPDGQAGPLRLPIDALAPDGALGRSARPDRYDLVCFSIVDWDFRWQRPQQIMAQFAEQGHRVFFLSTTRFLPPGGRRYAVRPLRENVWEVKVAVPRAIDVYGGDLDADQARAVLASLAALRADFRISYAVSVVQVATWAPAAYRARDAFGWRIVYDCMDEWDTFPGMRPALLAEERRLVQQCDLLVVSGQKLWEKWSPAKSSIVLARNAADFERFARAEARGLLRDARRPVVGYFGAIAEWFDRELMLRLARERPDYTFVLLGGAFGVDLAELERLPNVRLLGQQPYELMPAYLREFDACIIPFKVNRVTEATDPVKFYEYVSQGKPVVAPRMPELYPYRDLLYIAADHDDFLRLVDRAVQEDDPGLRARRIALARENTWQARVGLIAAGIQQVHPKASIVIVTYNNLEYTRLCLESVFRNTLYPSYEVVVVDNGSSDGTPDYLRALAGERTDVKIVLNEQNRGFAGASNQGIAASTGHYLVLLNNDTVVPNGWLPRLLRHLDRPEIGLVVSVTNFAGNEARIDVPYADLAEMEEFAARYTREHEGQVFDIRVAAMYCVGLRREVYARVGPLDERFTIGMFEDDDYSHRVRLAGLRVVCAEDVFVHHFGQASFKQLTPAEYQAIWDRNQRLYEEKWGVKWEPHQPRRAGEALGASSRGDRA